MTAAFRLDEQVTIEERTVQKDPEYGKRRGHDGHAHALADPERRKDHYSDARDPARKR